ncbi:pyruvate dehydrogenase E1 component subunit alpha, somatic form, mitochondrial-like isoform X2 [Rhodnius prolixus]|uniref:pyruvate dehydrogenase E1 component subunit alpha, somatic form, mitochondrial-like isoform X2 n=1 Tax=Rhodnius prolixus TaxID=13249 RepID=UPI003D188897
MQDNSLSLILFYFEEAVAVGIQATMRPDDCLITAYRAHGWVLLMGGSPEQILGELCGRVIGCSRGKGGSMHTYAKNFFGGNGIVGAQIPMGTGIGLMMKLTGKPNVSFALYGDGAANQGQVFEAYNLAKLWNLPVIFVCENNKYGMGTSAERASAVPEFYTRGDYIPGIQVDGMDVLATREASLFAIAHCISNRGPILLEMVTYRYYGHSMSDPGTSYRSRNEVQDIRKNKDPITLFKDKILGANLVSEEEIKQLDNETKKIIEEATAKVRAAPVPGPEELVADVYKKPVTPNVRGVNPWRTLKHIQITKPK